MTEHLQETTTVVPEERRRFAKVADKKRSINDQRIKNPCYEVCWSFIADFRPYPKFAAVAIYLYLIDNTSCVTGYICLYRYFVSIIVIFAIDSTIYRTSYFIPINPGLFVRRYKSVFATAALARFDVDICNSLSF